MSERTYGGKTAAERAEDRRSRLLAAGLAAFGTAGYAPTTIEGLCRAAGVTARHFYEHFPSREDLLLAVYEVVLTEHRGAIASALGPEPDPDFEAWVRRAVAAAVEAWTSHPHAARVAFVEVVGVSPRVEQRRLGVVAEYTELVMAIADDLHRRGLAAAPARALAARALVGALIAMVELWLTEPEPPTTDDMVAEGTTVALALLG